MFVRRKIKRFVAIVSESKISILSSGRSWNGIYTITAEAKTKHENLYRIIVMYTLLRDAYDLEFPPIPVNVVVTDRRTGKRVLDWEQQMRFRPAMMIANDASAMGGAIKTIRACTEKPQTPLYAVK